MTRLLAVCDQDHQSATQVDVSAHYFFAHRIYIFFRPEDVDLSSNRSTNRPSIKTARLFKVVFWLITNACLRIIAQTVKGSKRMVVSYPTLVEPMYMSSCY